MLAQRERRPRYDRHVRGILTMAAVKTTWVVSLLSCSLTLFGSLRFLQLNKLSTGRTKHFDNIQSDYWPIIPSQIIIDPIKPWLRSLQEWIFIHNILSTYDSPICQNVLTIYLTQIFSCQIIYDAVILTIIYNF